MSVTVRLIGDADSTQWDAFLETQSSGSFYHLSGWRRIIEDSLDHRTYYLAAHDGGRMLGALPLVLVSSRLFGRILCSVPFLNYGGPCAVDPQATSELTNGAIRLAVETRADYLELRCRESLGVDMPVSLRKVSLSLELKPDPDEIWNAFTGKHRKNVRRAYKHGLSVTCGGEELLDSFYDVLQHSWRNLGTPLYKRSYFESIIRTFPRQVSIYLCSHGTEPVAVALTGVFAGTAEGMWAGALPAARSLQANYVLYWEMIRDLCSKGCHSFHLGRSTTDSGSEQFKSRWNAEARQLYWYFYRPDGGAMPELNVENPRFKLAIALWRHLPLSITRRLGPPLARCIP